MIGNDAMCRVVRIGNVKLKVYDGLIYELKQVRHVPVHKRNLISLDMMDKIRCIIKVQRGVLSIVKWSLVLLKGTKKSRLYILEDIAIIREVSVSSISNVDKTMLWHLRLGHMSLKDLKELSK